MKPWSVVRVVGPVSIGLALVILRPTWQSVAVLGLLIVVAVWLDAQERRADDVEDLEEHLNARVSGLADRVKHLEPLDDMVTGLRKDTSGWWEAHEKRIDGLKKRVDEHGQRLDSMAQQRKGPML